MTKSNYKWVLRAGSKKDICPACGQRRFVPYVSAVDGKTPAGAQYGRCDREQHCRYIMYPNSSESKTLAERLGLDKMRPQPAEHKETLRISSDIFKVIDKVPLPFYTWMRTLFARELLLDACRSYRVAGLGTRVCFFQIDRDYQVHAGKLIEYKADGHRNKNVFPPVQWLHKVKTVAPYIKGEELEQCFFGEHLLGLNEAKPVAVVESEKTALIFSIVMPQAIWLATGGVQNLRRLAERPALKGRKVLLIPDQGCYFQWRNIAAQHQGWDISDKCEKSPYRFDGCDILDLYELKRKRIKDSF